jgi:hypothetical protein
VFAELQREAEVLGTQLKNLSNREESLNLLAQQINQLGTSANENIASYNAEVQEYNDIFGNRETFTQGDFERERINVYKFSTTEELVRVIAHEFGHALGIGHVDGEDSIMYYLLTDRDFKSPSVADMNAVQAVCGDSTTLAQKVRHLIRTALTTIV